MITDNIQLAEGDFVMVHESDWNVYLDEISAFIDDRKAELREISLEMHVQRTHHEVPALIRYRHSHDNPELQYKEFHAHKILTEYLAKQPGWEVTPSAYDITTAFVAIFDSGLPGPVVSFNAEYDALVGIGHACGHNLIAVASVAGALATAKIVKDHDLRGKVVLFGTPAEEGGGGKIKLLKAGAFTDNKVDISLISHPGIDTDSPFMHTAAFTSFKAEFFGKEAHAADRPYDGINALDALVTSYNALSALRQQTQQGDTIQAQILSGGARPNIIHAYSSGRFVVRSATRKRRDALLERVKRCFEGGALATGAELVLKIEKSYEDHVPNKVLAGAYAHALRRMGGGRGVKEPAELDEMMNWSNASTDQGDVSYVVPSLSVNFWIRSEDENGKQLGGPHTPDFEKAARTEEAHEKALRVGKALAATAVDILTVPGLLMKAKAEFKKMKDVEESGESLLV